MADPVTWESDHQARALARHGLATEFPQGCDAIEYVACALLAARKAKRRREQTIHQLRTSITVALDCLRAFDADAAAEVLERALNDKVHKA